MLDDIKLWHWAIAAAAFIVLLFVTFFSAMARFLKRPSPSEAIIRIGRSMTDVFIGRACWIVPILHRAATMSLSTIGLTIRRASHDALVSKDFVSVNLSAQFFIRVEPNEDDVKKAARTIGIDEGHASTEAMRAKSQDLLEPKLIGALRAVAAQNDFLALHMNREHFAAEVSTALREDLGRNGFTLESVTITELVQTPLNEMRTDDIFGASGRETTINTIVAKNIAVRRKQQEEAERTAEIHRTQEINVAQQDRMMREGKAKEEEAAIKAEIFKNEAIETRDLQRQANISVERAKKDEAEQTSEIAKQRAVEAALVDKQITLTLKARESLEADAQKAAAQAIREKADQEVITVQQVAEAERQKRVAIVSSEKASEQEKIGADVEAYKKKVEAEALANSVKAGAEGRADAARFEAQGLADAVKIKAKADADAAEMQAVSITRLAEANRQAGLKEAEVLREKAAAINAKSRDTMLQETALRLLEAAPSIVRELVKPAEKIAEIKVLNIAGMGQGNGHGDGAGANASLGNVLGPVAKTIVEASAVMPLVKEMLKFADVDGIKQAVVGALRPPAEPQHAPQAALADGSLPAPAPAAPGQTTRRPPRPPA
jgi:uncharacterized membrane protein YqiK